MKDEIKLTNAEKNMLDKLTNGNKMDCWFWIDDRNGVIIDLENNNQVLDTRKAILDVAAGTVDIEMFLNEDEIALFDDLVKRCEQ